MFESLINGLLQRFLAPYVDGLGKDKISLTVRSGNFKLTNLTLKQSLLANLGVDVAELAGGHLDLLEIQVPLRSLFKQKIHVRLHGLSVTAKARREAAHSDEQALKQLRENRRGRVKVRSEQLQEILKRQRMVEAARKVGSEVENRVGLGAKLTKKLIENFTVDIANITAGLRDAVADSEVSIHLGSAFVKSPDPADFAILRNREAQLRKSIGIQNLKVEVGTTRRLKPLLLPLQLSLRVEHDSVGGQVGVRLAFGGDQGTGAQVSIDQVQQVAALAAGLMSEAVRLQNLLTPPGTAELVHLNTAEEVEGTQQEFVDLFRREAHEELGTCESMERLNREERWRLSILWDVVPEENLARWIQPVMVERELLQKRLEETQRRNEAAAQQERTVFGRWFGRGGAGGNTPQANPADEDEETEEAWQKLRADAEALESLEVPQTITAEVVLASFSLEVRASQEDVVRVGLLGAEIKAYVESGVEDHRRLPTVKHHLAISAQGASVTQTCGSVTTKILSFEFDRAEQAAAEVGGTLSMSPQSTSSTSALSLRLWNDLGSTQTVQNIRVTSQPLKVRVVDTFVRSLKKFATAATEAMPETLPQKAAQDAIQSYAAHEYLVQAGEWLHSSKGREVVSNVTARIPDALNFHINLDAPRVQMALPDTRKLDLSFGHFTLETLTDDEGNAASLESFHIRMIFRDLYTTVKDRLGIKHEVVKPFTLESSVRMLPDSTECHGHCTPLSFAVSPEVLRFVAAVPGFVADITGDDGQAYDADPDHSAAPTAPPPAALTAASFTAEAAHTFRKTVKEVMKATAEVTRKPSDARSSGVRSSALSNFQTAAHSHIQSFRERRSTTKLLAEEACKELLTNLQLQMQVHAQSMQNRVVRVSFELERSVLQLLDPPNPVARLELQCESLEASFYPSNSMLDSTASFQLGMEVFNVRVGRFEPLIEPFKLAGHAMQSAGGNTVSLSLQGRQSLLLNVTPTTTKSLAWYIPNLVAAVSDTEAVQEVATEPRYRLLNLTGRPVKVKFLTGGDKKIEPVTAYMDGKYLSLDQSVLTSWCERIELDDKVQLSLAHVGSVQMPGGSVAQLLRPRVNYALVLISPTCLLFNETSLPVRIRATGTAAVIPCSHCGGTALFKGETPKEHSEGASAAAGRSPWALLLPGEFAGVPLSGDAKLEVATPDGNWATVEEGLMAGSSESSVVSIDCGCGAHFLAHCSGRRTEPPAQQTLRLVRLLPAVRFVSGLPCGSQVEFRVQGEPEASARCLRLPPLGEGLVYDVVTPARLTLRVKLEDGPWSESWATLPVGSLGQEKEEVDLCIPASHKASKASLVVSQRKDGELVLYCPLWIIDRTGWDLLVSHSGAPLQVFDQIALGTHDFDKHELIANGKTGPRFALPRAAPEWAQAKLPDGRMACVRSTDLPHSDTQGCPVRCLEVIPRLVVKNQTDNPAQFQVTETSEVWELQPGEMLAPKFCHTELRFSILPISEDRPAKQVIAWSKPFFAEEVAAGAWPFMLRGEVWTVEVRPDRGMLCLLLRQGSDFSIKNHLKDPCWFRVRDCSWIEVGPSAEAAFGWVDPLGADIDFVVEVSLDRKRATVSLDPRAGQERKLGSSAVITSVLVGRQTCLDVKSAKTKKGQEKAMRFELLLSRVGLSLIGENSPRGARHAEFFYAELDLLRICAEARPEEDMQLLDIAISDLQLDFQCASKAPHSVVLANRGTSGVGAGSLNPFFRLVVVRGRTSTVDLSLQAARIEVDPLELTVRDEILEAMLAFTQDAVAEAEEILMIVPGVAMERIRRCAGTSLLAEGFSMPELERCVEVSQMHVSVLEVQFWCKLRLSLLNLPRWLQVILSTLTFSRSLSMEGSAISLQRKEIKGVRGSTTDFVLSVTQEYIGDAIQSVLSLLGTSSLFNVPRAPLKLGGAIGGFAAQRVSSVVSHAAGVIDHLALDASYLQFQRRVREQKNIQGFREGVREAMQELGNGLDGMLDIVRKPVQGGMEGGVGGFVQGVGKGLLAGVAKPVGAVGRAVTDVTAGVAATVSGAGATRQQKIRSRRRLQRLLAGPLGAVVEFSRLEARLAADPRSLPAQIEAVIPVKCTISNQTPATDGQRSSPRASAAQAGDAGELRRLEVLVVCSGMLVYAQVHVPPPPDRSGPDFDGEEALLASFTAGDYELARPPPAAPPGQDQMREVGGQSGSGGQVRRCCCWEFVNNIEMASMPPAREAGTAAAPPAAPAMPAGPPSPHTTSVSTEDVACDVRASCSTQSTAMVPSSSDQPNTLRSTSLASRVSIKTELVVLWQLHLPLAMVEWKATPEGQPRQIVLKAWPRDGRPMRDMLEEVVSLPQQLGEEMQQALFDSLRSCTSEIPTGDWTASLRAALSRAKVSALSGITSEASHTCTVWEVQRSVGGVWGTPTDSEQQHRWMEKSCLRRHQMLDPTRNWADAEEPPVVLLPVWVPLEDWRRVVEDDTDAEGWQYAMVWRSRTWKRSPGVFDAVRRRRWERRYHLNDASNSLAVDSSWAQHAGTDRQQSCSRVLRRCCCCCCEQLASRAVGGPRSARGLSRPL